MLAYTSIWSAVLGLKMLHVRGYGWRGVALLIVGDRSFCSRIKGVLAV